MKFTREELMIISSVIQKINDNNCLVLILQGIDKYVIDIHYLHCFSILVIDIDTFDFIKITTIRELQQLQNYLKSLNYQYIYIVTYDYDYKNPILRGKITFSNNVNQIVSQIKNLIIDYDKEVNNVTKEISFKVLDYHEDIKLN